jgi:hypothetical protein
MATYRSALSDDDPDAIIQTTEVKAVDLDSGSQFVTARYDVPLSKREQIARLRAIKAKLQQRIVDTDAEIAAITAL